MDRPWWWSACSPSTPTIWVWIPLTPTIFSVIFEFEKTENKQKKRPGLAHIRRTKFDFYTKSLKLQFEAWISAPLSLWKRVSGRERERERERGSSCCAYASERERGARSVKLCRTKRRRRFTFRVSSKTFRPVISKIRQHWNKQLWKGDVTKRLG